MAGLAASVRVLLWKNWRVKQRESRLNRRRTARGQWLFPALLTDIVLPLTLLLLLIRTFCQYNVPINPDFGSADASVLAANGATDMRSSDDPRMGLSAVPIDASFPRNASERLAELERKTRIMRTQQSSVRAHGVSNALFMTALPLLLQQANMSLAVLDRSHARDFVSFLDEEYRGSSDLGVPSYRDVVKMIPFNESMTDAQANALLRSFPAQSRRMIYASVDVRAAAQRDSGDELVALLNYGTGATSPLETDQMVKYFARTVIGNTRYLRFPGILVLQSEANRFLERLKTGASRSDSAGEPPSPAAMCQALDTLLHMSFLQWTDLAASASLGRSVADCEAAVRDGVVSASLRRYLIDLAHTASATDALQTLDVSALPKRAHATTPGPLENAIVVYMAYLFLWPYVRLVRDIVVEKEKQLTEYLLIMGLRPMALLLSWYALYFGASVVLSVLATALLSDAMFAATPASAASFLLLLVTFASSILLLGVSITPIFSQAKTAAATASLVYFVLSAGPFIRALVSEDALDASAALTSVVTTLEAISSPVVFMTALHSILGLDASTHAVRPIAWSTVRGPCGAMAIQSAGYLLLGWYLENVFPRTYGVQQRWYFVVQPSYWFPRASEAAGADSADEQAELLGLGTTAVGSDDQNDGDDDDASDATLREMPLRAFVRQFKPALVVQRLSKQYPNGKQALSNVSFGVKKGEIFGLLGPNGAGKSTTLSILCGTLAPTSGDAVVRGAGASVRSNPEAIRTSLSVCFQQNILFDDLTVDEHVALVCALKRAIGVETIGPDALDATLAQFGLTEKRDALAKTLSGGQKRKLSLVLALVDNARVVLLDEPTAGMDLHARVATWDALKRAVRHRAVILTTHSMQEAEALCENIGIVADGRLRCCGSSLFLRERYGVGYKLTLVHPNDGDRDTSSSSSSGAAVRRVTTAALVQAVRAFVPRATVASDNKWETRLQLTDGDERHFAALFRALDAMRARREIKRYALAATDLEDVFVRVTEGEDVYHHAQDDVAVDAASKPTDATASYGATLGAESRTAARASVSWSQLSALVVKRLKLSVRDKKTLVAQYVWPIALFALLLVAVQHVALDDESIETLTTLSRSAAASSYLLVAATPELAPRVHAMLSHVDHVVYRDAASAADMVDLVLHEDNATAFYAAAYISALDVAGPSASAHDRFAFALLYNKSIPRSLPVGLETLSEAHCRATRPPGQLCRLTVKTGTLTFQPESNGTSSSDPTVDLMNRIVLAFYLLFTLSTIVSYYATPVVKERESGVKRQQYLHLASHATSRLYWSAHFAFDYSVYVAAATAVVAVVAVLATSVTREMLVVWSVGLVLFGAAVLPFTYATSLLFASHSSAQSFLSYASLFQILATMATAFMSVTPGLCVKVHTAALVLECLPFYALGMLVLNVATVQLAAERAQCIAHATGAAAGQDAAGLVAALSAPAPSVWDWSVSGRYFAALASSAVAYALVLLVCDDVQMYPTVVSARLERLWTAVTRVVCWSSAASDYGAVATGADARPSDLERATHALVDVVHVTKVFNRKARAAPIDSDGASSDRASPHAADQVVALRDVSFSVERNDCVALLGVNGSGKSTMFEILTGGTAPTRGQALIDECDVTRAPLDASQRFGYCPQTNVLFSDLSVREHLELFHRLRARAHCSVTRERAVVDSLLRRLDLVPVETTAAAHLSGGNKRRLMLALALLSDDVSLLLLDEPSAGVDVVARRLMWRILHEKRASRRSSTSCLFTTHSMEEAEAVCANAVVLLKGSLVWCGSIPELKHHASRGVAISLRLDSAVVLAPDRVAAYVNTVDAALGPRAQRHVRPDDLERVWTLCRAHYRPVFAASARETYVPVPNRMRRDDWIASVVVRTQDTRGRRAGATPAESPLDAIELDEFVKEWLIQEDLAALEQTLFADVVTRVSGEVVQSVDAQTASRSNTTAVYETKCTDACGLAALFDAMEANKTRVAIAQYSISELSLERVFEQFTSSSSSS